jgi:N-acyl-L-homoserine lactone synthetase
VVLCFSTKAAALGITTNVTTSAMGMADLAIRVTVDGGSVGEATATANDTAIWIHIAITMDTVVGRRYPTTTIAVASTAASLAPEEKGSALRTKSP